jgi:pimeloyl-ACP methyl ester carboxylesterase
MGPSFSEARQWLALLALSLAAPALAIPASTPRACGPLNTTELATSPPFTSSSYRFASGNVKLGGCLYRPRGLDRFPVVVLVAGSGDEPTAASTYSVAHAKAFAAKGIGVLAFDKRGVGDSAGTATGTDFAQRAADVAAAVQFAKSLPSTTGVGLWGVSQAGWVVPQALRLNDGVELVILVSPAGVNPNDQMAFFIRNLMLQLGLTPGDAAQAEQLHRIVVRYYATGLSYEAAQQAVDADRAKAWFERLRTNGVWNEKIGPGGRLLTPAELKKAWKDNPGAFEFYRAPSVFADYRTIYEALDRPTLIVQGSADTIVDIAESDATFAAVFRKNGNTLGVFKVFEGAEHGIVDGPQVRPAYLDFISDWAKQRFASKRL